MGKDSLFTTQDLTNIINKYYESNRGIRKISFSNLARFAQEELNIDDIEYYHFSRNKEINQSIKEYNKSANNLENFTRDDSFFTKLNVKEFVKLYVGNKSSLTFLLTRLQEIHTKLYDSKIDLQLECTKLRNNLHKLKEKTERYRMQIKILREEKEALIEQNKVLLEALGVEEEKQLISALNSTGLYEVKTDQKEIIEKEENIKELNNKNGTDLEKLIDQYSDLFD